MAAREGMDRSTVKEGGGRGGHVAPFFCASERSGAVCCTRFGGTFGHGRSGERIGGEYCSLFVGASGHGQVKCEAVPEEMRCAACRILSGDA